MCGEPGSQELGYSWSCGVKRGFCLWLLYHALCKYIGVNMYIYILNRVQYKPWLYVWAIDVFGLWCKWYIALLKGNQTRDQNWPGSKKYANILTCMLHLVVLLIFIQEKYFLLWIWPPLSTAIWLALCQWKMEEKNWHFVLHTGIIYNVVDTDWWAPNGSTQNTRSHIFLTLKHDF